MSLGGGGDTDECGSAIHAWNRTPGKPNLSGNSGTIDASLSWSGNNKIVSTSRFTDNSKTIEDVWSNLSDSATSRKIDNTALWPTPAEVVGKVRNDAGDFSMQNSWNVSSASASLPLHSPLGNSDEHSPSESGWPSGSGQHGSSSTNNSCGPRAITGQQRSSSGGNGSSMTVGINEGSIFTGKAEGGRTMSGEGSTLNATACSSISDSINHTDGNCENDEIVNVLVNTKECWGQRPVDQSTPWNVSSLSNDDIGRTGCGTGSSASSFGQTSGLLGDAVALALQAPSQRRIKGGLASKQSSSLLSGGGGAGGSFESNVWPSEPPNGTGIWESHYESIGERTSRWKNQQSTGSPSTVTSSPGLSRLSTTGSMTATAGPLGRGSIISPPGPSSSLLSSYSNSGGSASPNYLSSGGIGGGGSSSCGQRPTTILNYPGGGGGGGGTSYLPQQSRYGAPFQLSSGGRSGGSNGMLGIPSSGFRQMHTSGSHVPTNWPTPLSDSARLDDVSKAFANNVSSWPDNPPHGRSIGKQLPVPGDRWPSPVNEVGPPSAWLPSDPRKLLGLGGNTSWNHQPPHPHKLPFSTNLMPQIGQLQSPTQHQQSAYLLTQRMDSATAATAAAVAGAGVLPHRFPRPTPIASSRLHNQQQQLPQRQSSTMGNNSGSSGHFGGIRPQVIRYLFDLGFIEEAKSLISDPGIDLERLLFDLRDRTGHPGLNQPIMLVTSFPSGSMNSSDSSFDGFFDHTPSSRQQIRPNSFATGGGPLQHGGGGGLNRFGRMSSGASAGGGTGSAVTTVNQEHLATLQQLEAETMHAIRHLQGKYQEISLKQQQLCKLNVGPAPNPLLQELKLQNLQILQQIEANDYRLRQIRVQATALNMSSGNQSPLGAPPGPSLANVAHMSAATAAASWSGPGDEICVGQQLQQSGGGGTNLRGITGIGMPRPPQSSHFSLSSGIPRHLQQHQQQNRPMAFGTDLSSRMSHLKLSQQSLPPSQMDFRRQFAWDSGAWSSSGPDDPGMHSINDTSDLNLNFDDASLCQPSANPLCGDRRWAPPDSSSAANCSDSPWTVMNGPSVVDDIQQQQLQQRSLHNNNCWLLISDLSPHISLDSLKMAITTALPQSAGASGNRGSGTGPPSPTLNSDFELHPNVAARYVLLGLSGVPEANAVANILDKNALTSGVKFGSADIISHNEAMAKLQEIKNLVTQVVDDDDPSGTTSWILSSGAGVGGSTGATSGAPGNSGSSGGNQNPHSRSTGNNQNDLGPFGGAE